MMRHRRARRRRARGWIVRRPRAESSSASASLPWRRGTRPVERAEAPRSPSSPPRARRKRGRASPKARAARASSWPVSATRPMPIDAVESSNAEPRPCAARSPRRARGPRRRPPGPRSADSAMPRSSRPIVELGIAGPEASSPLRGPSARLDRALRLDGSRGRAPGSYLELATAQVVAAPRILSLPAWSTAHSPRAPPRRRGSTSPAPCTSLIQGAPFRRGHGEVAGPKSSWARPGPFAVLLRPRRSSCHRRTLARCPARRARSRRASVRAGARAGRAPLDVARASGGPGRSRRTGRKAGQALGSLGVLVGQNFTRRRASASSRRGLGRGEDHDP